MNSERTTNRKGFTLAEATLALVILGIAAAGALLPYSAGAAAQADGRHRTLAGKLAGERMEQIARTPFEQILATWDGQSEDRGQVEDAAGVAFTDPMYANFSRTVTCMEVYVPPEQGFALPQFILATVEVRYLDQTVATVNRLIGM